MNNLIGNLRAEIDRLRDERENFYADYRLKCDVETKLLQDEIERLDRVVASLKPDAQRYRASFISWWRNPL